MMIINEKLETVFYGKVRRKANNTRNINIRSFRESRNTGYINTNLRDKTNRVLKRTPEVMTKITGFTKSSGGVKSNIEYITRNGKVELEDNHGNLYLGKDSINEFFDEWNSFDREERKKNQRDTMKLVLSMPEGTDPEKLKQAAKEFLKEEFFNHEYVFALHTDDKHPHVHVSVKCLGFDQQRLDPRKKDIQNWREGFAEKLRQNGIEAEATPRRVRGVVKKSESQIIRHIEAEEAKRKARKSTVRESQKKQATAALRDDQLKPWDKAIRKNQRETKQAWLDAAEELDKSSPEDKILASRIKRFVENFPKPETVTDKLKKEIKSELKRDDLEL